MNQSDYDIIAEGIYNSLGNGANKSVRAMVLCDLGETFKKRDKKFDAERWYQVGSGVKVVAVEVAK